MPFIDVTLIEGRPPEKLRAFMEALTAAAETTLDAPRDSIRVVLREVAPTHWAAGGETVAERRQRLQAEKEQG